MNLPDLPSNASRRELRKAMLRMRLEMRRQEIRHEALLLMQPLQQARDIGMSLRSSSAPLWFAGGTVALAGLLGGKRKWRSWLRIALVLAPLLRRRNSATPPPTEAAHHD